MIVIAELTRLSRSTKDLIYLVGELEAKGANIKSLKEDWVDTTTAQGKLMYLDFVKIKNRLFVQDFHNYLFPVL